MKMQDKSEKPPECCKQDLMGGSVQSSEKLNTGKNMNNTNQDQEVSNERKNVLRIETEAMLLHYDKKKKALLHFVHV